MKKLWLLVFLFSVNLWAGSEDLYSIQLKTLDGKNVKMSDYKGKVLLFVNTASKCGFTPQFKDLVELQKIYGPRGFQVLAFPSNDFKQDPAENIDVKKFADDIYKVNFPMFDKAPVRGDDKQAVYKYLVSQRNDILNEVSWNFEKFLVDQNGKVVDRFSSRIKPMDKKLVEQIEKLVKK